jgi:prepilin-type N-terminal cleavage/methylation domain-containing protein/prepilin-type processing-associated H-X9-DG protein
MRQQRPRRERGFTWVSLSSEVRKRRRLAFTLVELLVVIGIIALLISILLPALSRARESANTIKCAANLRSVGQGIAQYVTDNKNTYPAAYYYDGMKISGGQQTPDAPLQGYVHWSSLIYKRKDQSNSDAPFRQLSGWDMFTCPSMDKGGLPPTDTYPANNDALPNDVAGIVDKQSPRIAYTVNEAICPRNKFVIGFQQSLRTYSFVRGGAVRNSAGTILATEVSKDAVVYSDQGEASGQIVCKSHRPVHGFYSPLGGLDMNKVGVSLGGQAALYRVTANLLNADPDTQIGPNRPATTQTRLDWVGRVHGRRKLVNGIDKRMTNFLYVDGHVETKTVFDTLSPKFEWGDKFYSLNPGNDIKN